MPATNCAAESPDIVVIGHVVDTANGIVELGGRIARCVLLHRMQVEALLFHDLHHFRQQVVDRLVAVGCDAYALPTCQKARDRAGPGVRLARARRPLHIQVGFVSATS